MQTDAGDLDRNAAEALLYRAEVTARLAKSVFDSTSQAIVVTDAHNIIQSVNPAFETITGYAADEVCGHNPNMLSSGRQDAAFYRTMWDQLMAADKWSGEIWNRRKSGETFPEWLTISVVRDAAGAITNYVAVFSDVTAQKSSEATIQKLAFTDRLTGLANRLYAEQRIEALLTQACRDNKSVALILLDLDRFKGINSTHGHQAGDEALIEVARRLSKIVTASDLLARLGGDEFLVALGNLDGTDRAMRRAEEILKSVAKPLVLSDPAGSAFPDQTVQLSASLGIALYPGDGQNPYTLMQFAEQAMYASKEHGGTSYRFFSKFMQEDAIRRSERETRLRRAVAHADFYMTYQPQVDLRLGEIVAAEALVRANDPEIGGPDEFIPLAEQWGLIHSLGDFTLRESCRQARLWREGGSPIQRVAINISAAQFNDPALVEKIAAALAAEGLPPEAIEVEMTETAAMANPDQTIRTLTALKELGLEIAIDDFGTGYSSLAYLRNFPINRVKIDRAFVINLETNPSDVELVRAIISLSKSLNLDTLAEGVETERQSAILRSLGCDMAQGYLFGRPERPH